MDKCPYHKISLKPYWSYAKHIANERVEQKKFYKSSLPLSENYEMVGVLGEIVYAIEMGEDFNEELLVDGDDGSDFINDVNVKTSEEHIHCVEAISFD